MKQKHTFLLILLLATILAQAQVTIGSGEKPNAGALLDLKTETNGSSKLGLGLPRVKLTDLAPASNTDLAKSIGNTTGSYDMTEHIGLIVYNVKDEVFDPATCITIGAPIGLYVWDGTQWQGLGTSSENTSASVYKVTDSRDSEVYLARNFGATAGDWMLENMRYDPIAHPDAAFTGYVHIATNDNTAKHYAYAEGNISPYIPADHPSSGWPSKKKNGIFYNWLAATNGQNISTGNQGHGQATEGPTTPIQGICPANWHVPSDKELNQLEEVFASSTTEYTNSAATPFTWEANTLESWRPNSANVFGHGKSMKSACSPVGSSGATSGDSKTAQNGGFALLLAGYAYNRSAVNYNQGGYLWSSSSSNGTNAWSRTVGSTFAGVSRNAYNRYFLFSVRCKKN